MVSCESLALPSNKKLESQEATIEDAKQEAAAARNSLETKLCQVRPVYENRRSLHNNIKTSIFYGIAVLGSLLRKGEKKYTEGSILVSFFPHRKK
jgi:hypothetical protein